MKIFQTLMFIAIVSISLHSNAQKSFVIHVIPTPGVNKDTLCSFVVVIPQVVLKEVKKDWLQYIRKESIGNTTEINGTYLHTNVINANISPAPFIVYSNLIEITSGVRLHVWLDENSVSKDLNSGQHLAFQKFVYDFVVQQYRLAVQKELKAEQAKQKKLESNLAGYIKSEEKSVKKVSENDRNNERANDAIISNKSDIYNSNEKISDQKQNVDRNAADPNAVKGSKKTLGELEDNKKDLQNQIDANNKKVENSNKENRAEGRKMAALRENQANTTAALETQKQIVRDVQIKLDNIK